VLLLLLLLFESVLTAAGNGLKVGSTLWLLSIDKVNFYLTVKT
jgi:hypothetical protein